MGHTSGGRNEQMLGNTALCARMGHGLPGWLTVAGTIAGRAPFPSSTCDAYHGDSERWPARTFRRAWVYRVQVAGRAVSLYRFADGAMERERGFRPGGAAESGARSIAPWDRKPRCFDGRRASAGNADHAHPRRIAASVGAGEGVDASGLRRGLSRVAGEVEHSLNCWSASPSIPARVLSNWYPIEEG